MLTLIMSTQDGWPALTAVILGVEVFFRDVAIT